MPPAKLRLLLATTNAGKRRELAALIDPTVWECVTPAQSGVAALHVPETGSTYRENAARKAHAYATASGLPALADDSGLEVDALEGAPGVRSARYAAVDLADPAARDRANRATLLAALHGIPPERRGARFQAVVAIALPHSPDVRFGAGTWEGRIAGDERGAGGFGYDSLFELPDGRRVAELSDEEKNRLSHRALALRNVGPILDSIANALREAAAEQEGRRERGGPTRFWSD